MYTLTIETTCSPIVLSYDNQEAAVQEALRRVAQAPSATNVDLIYKKNGSVHIWSTNSEGKTVSRADVT